MADEKYIRGIADAIKAQQETSEINKRSSLHAAELLKTRSLATWMELKAWLEEAVSQAKQLGSGLDLMDKQNQNQITLNCNIGQKINSMTVKFTEGDGRIAATGVMGFSSTFIPSVQGSEVIFSEISNIGSYQTAGIVDVEKMGTLILNHVANYRG